MSNSCLSCPEHRKQADLSELSVGRHVSQLVAYAAVQSATRKIVAAPGSTSVFFATPTHRHIFGSSQGVKRYACKSMKQKHVSMETQTLLDRRHAVHTLCFPSDFKQDAHSV